MPLRIGVRQIDIVSYPSRPFYILNFNEFKLEDRVKGRFDHPYDMNAIQSGINTEKDRIRNSMPLKITINRDVNEDMELLRIEEILDKEGNQLNINFFNLQVQSMSEVDDFWLDSGIFSLNINNNK